jgi:multiple sugar transport system substrate-binding protein
MLADEPPDVAFVYESRWMKAGQVLDLSETIAEYGIDTDAMNQVALSECRLDGKLYCLGSLTGAVMLIYNKDLFDQAGVEYPPTDRPWTIDEYAEASTALHRSLGIWGSAASAPFTWADRLTHFDPEGRKIEGYVDDEPTIHMYEVLTSLATEGASPLPDDAELTTTPEMMAAGDLAMTITDVEYAAAALAGAGYAYGAAPPPTERAGDDPFIFVGTDKYGVFSQSKNQATAAALVAFIAQEGNQIRVDVSDRPPLDSGLLPEWVGDDPGRESIVEALKLRSADGLFVPGYWEVLAPLEDYFHQMAYGEADPRPAILEQTPVMQEKLDSQWGTWEAIK